MTLSNLTALEVIAGLFALLAIVKIGTILISRKAWFKGVVKPVYTHAKITAAVYIILSTIVFYFLIQSFTIVQIFAVMGLSSLLLGWGLLLYHKDLLNLAHKVLYSKKTNIWFWVQVIVWLVLSAWVIYEIVM